MSWTWQCSYRSHAKECFSLRWRPEPPAEAVNNFLDPLQRVVSCVTQAQLNVKGGYYPTTGEPHALVLGDGLPQKLPGETNLSLVVKQFYYVIRVEELDRGPWRVSTAEYNYNLRDADNRVVLAFHWHPAERFKVRHPHLHLDQGARLGREDLHRTATSPQAVSPSSRSSGSSSPSSE